VNNARDPLGKYFAAGTHFSQKKKKEERKTQMLGCKRNPNVYIVFYD